MTPEGAPLGSLHMPGVCQVKLGFSKRHPCDEATRGLAQSHLLQAAFDRGHDCTGASYAGGGLKIRPLEPLGMHAD